MLPLFFPHLFTSVISLIPDAVLKGHVWPGSLTIPLAKTPKTCHVTNTEGLSPCLEHQEGSRVLKECKKQPVHRAAALE